MNINTKNNNNYGKDSRRTLLQRVARMGKS